LLATCCFLWDRVAIGLEQRERLRVHLDGVELTPCFSERIGQPYVRQAAIWVIGDGVLESGDRLRVVASSDPTVSALYV
jgi:hypothetical protein